jgi:Tol biopolymer transport system component
MFRETGALERLTHPPSTAEGDRAPVLSPDGKSIAFVRWREGARTEIFVRRLDDGNEASVLSHEGIVRGLDWWRDGSALTFSSYWRGNTGLWRVSTGGGAPTRLPFGENARELTTARTGNRLVFSRSVSDSNVWRVGGPSAEEIVPPQKWIASTRDDWSPQYSPDGSRIAFASDRSGEPQIWIWESTSGEISRVPFEGSATVPRWSPDGRLPRVRGGRGRKLRRVPVERRGRIHPPAHR